MCAKGKIPLAVPPKLISSSDTSLSSRNGDGPGPLTRCFMRCAAPDYPRGRPQVQRSGLEATFGRGSLKPPFSRWTVLSDSALTPTPLPHNLFQLFMIRGAGRFVKRFLKNRAPDRLKCRRCAPCRWTGGWCSA